MRVWTFKGLWTVAAFLACAAAGHGQRFELTPLVGWRNGGSMDVQEEGQPSRGRARVGDSATFGVAAGFRFADDEACEDCSVVEFRWMRQNTHLGFKENTLVPVPTPLAAALGRVDLSMDHYLAEFTHEWNIEHARAIRPFVMASLGAARASTLVSGSTRFAFGLGAGVKIFPLRHWGMRFHMEWLPTVMGADIQRVACVNGCVIALSGGLMNQFEFSLGPVFRF